MSGPEQFISAEPIAKQLGQSVRTIHKWSQNGDIPAYWVVSSWRYKQSEIDDWMESNHRSSSRTDSLAEELSWEEKVKRCIDEISERIGEEERRELNLDQYSASSRYEQNVIDAAVQAFVKSDKYEINRRFKDRDGNRITKLSEKSFEKGR
jgi:excisionase family DNA binding protein